MDYNPPDSCVHWIFNNTGVGCHSLLQGIFPAQPRDQNWVSCVSFFAGGFFTAWATGEALNQLYFI